MASRVTVRFYQVGNMHKDGAVFADALKAISGEVDLSKRFRDSGEEGDDMQVRLERFHPQKDFILGEFTRLQTEDIPPEVMPDGLKPTALAGGIGLGHCAAFAYYLPTSTLALQINPQSVTHHTVSAYLYSYDHAYQFFLKAVPYQDVWTKFEDTEPRSFSIAIAGPANLAAAEKQDDVVVSAIRNLGAMYDGHVVTVEVSVGRKKESTLPKNAIRDCVKYFLGLQGNKKFSVRKVETTTNSRDNLGRYEEINFLREFLSEPTEIDLPSDNAEKSYEIRSEFAKTAVNKHAAYLKKFYG